MSFTWQIFPVNIWLTGIFKYLKGGHKEKKNPSKDYIRDTGQNSERSSRSTALQLKSMPNFLQIPIYPDVIQKSSSAAFWMIFCFLPCFKAASEVHKWLQKKEHAGKLQ